MTNLFHTMPIPKCIYQTFSTDRLPLITRLFIWWMKRINRDYQYEFFDDRRIEAFLASEYTPDVLQAYQQIGIGAAKADFFRYAILYKRGGVYIDIDGGIVRPLSLIIKDNDEAVLTKEGDHPFFVQWALIFGKDHPFMERTLRKVLDNIKHNRYPDNVHRMTGPSVFTEAVEECLRENPGIPHRIFGTDYERKSKAVMIPKHFLNRMIYFGHLHWKKQQRKRSVLKS